MSLGAKLLVGALVLGAAGTAGTYALTNGGFGIGGNGEGSNENAQRESNKNTSVPQEGASPSSDEAGRGSENTSLSPKPAPGPSPQTNSQDTTRDVPQLSDQHSGSANTNAQQQTQKENVGVAQIQSKPIGAPPATVTDQNESIETPLLQPSGGGEAGTQAQLAPAGGDDPQKAPAQIESVSNTDTEKSKETTDGVSVPGSKPEARQPSGTENSQSPLQPNQDGGEQDQVGKADQVIVSNV